MASKSNLGGSASDWPKPRMSDRMNRLNLEHSAIQWRYDGFDRSRCKLVIQFGAFTSG